MTISTYKQIIRFARLYLKNTFGEFYARREVTKVSNQLVKNKLLSHNALIHTAKKEFRSGKITREEYQKKVQVSSNNFDLEYTNVKKRAREVMDNQRAYCK